MKPPLLSYKNCKQIIHLTETINTNRDKVAALLAKLIEVNQLDSFLTELISYNQDTQQVILDIMSKGYSMQRLSISATIPPDFKKIVLSLAQLPAENLTRLHQFYETTPVSLACLADALQGMSKADNFNDFLLAFEKAPFGARDLNQQFECSQVERVINDSMDVLNETPYTWQHRKQLMERFSFVNQIGNDLPVYHGKSARELTNAEIKSFFAELKAQT